MPKKKLTKAQVSKKLITARNALYDLFLDKFAHGSDSFVSMSTNKLQDLYFPIMSAFTKLKRK